MELSDIKGKYKQIPEYPDYYITEHGEVYSKRPLGAAHVGYLRKLTPKSPGKASPHKYLNIILANQNGTKTFSVHRLVAQYFVDGYFDGAVVDHIDGNNRNNDASNLEWVTTKTNIHRSYKNSGIGALRHYKNWMLYDPEGNMLGTFQGSTALARFIEQNGLPTFHSSLVKYRESCGYRVEVSEK